MNFGDIIAKIYIHYEYHMADREKKKKKGAWGGIYVYEKEKKKVGKRMKSGIYITKKKHIINRQLLLYS